MVGNARFIPVVFVFLATQTYAFWPLRADVPNVQRFMMAAREGDVNTLRRHVLAGQDINQRDKDGCTALMQATLAVQPAAIRFLLQEVSNASDPVSNTSITGALRTAELRLKRRKEQLDGKGRSWKMENPPRLDSELKAISECVALLKDPGKQSYCLFFWDGLAGRHCWQWSQANLPDLGVRAPIVAHAGVAVPSKWSRAWCLSCFK
jgi:hypothetical protein